MEGLVFKMVSAPLLLLAASLAVRRWGATIGGVLVGLPLTSGPVSVFLALELGPTFAVQATSGSLSAAVGQIGFCLAFGRLAERGWIVATLGATAAFAVIAAGLQWSGWPQTALFVVAIVTLFVALRLVPLDRRRVPQPPAFWWDMPLRIVLMAGLVVGVTFVAPVVGPGLAGVIASYPFMAAIVGVFTLRFLGAGATRQLMRGMIAGLFGFAGFFYAASLALNEFPIGVAYAIAIVCALALQGAALLHLRARRAAAS